MDTGSSLGNNQAYDDVVVVCVFVCMWCERARPENLGPKAWGTPIPRWVTVSSSTACRINPGPHLKSKRHSIPLLTDPP